MEEVFKIEHTDYPIVNSFKKEANILLASFDKIDDSYLITKSKLQDAIEIVRTLGRIDIEHEDDISSIIKYVNKFLDNYILSPLTLNDDEFNKESSNGVRVNNRYPYIYKFKDKIYNKFAFKCYIRHKYNHQDNKEIDTKPFMYNMSNRLYISKGGIITGEYVENCIIRQDIVDRHSFTIQSIVIIPVSIIWDNGKFIYVVDHREPKLKALREFYDVPINIDESIKGKYNLRKYVKLNK